MTLTFSHGQGHNFIFISFASWLIRFSLRLSILSHSWDIKTWNLTLTFYLTLNISKTNCPIATKFLAALLWTPTQPSMVPKQIYIKKFLLRAIATVFWDIFMAAILNFQILSNIGQKPLVPMCDLRCKRISKNIEN